MPQLANITVMDGAATPASHVFVPSDITGGVATLVESTGVPVGDRRVSMALAKTAQQGRRKVTVKLVLPVVQDQVINGVSKPTVVRTAYADVTFSFDQTSSLQERKDASAMLVSVLGNALTKSVINDLQNLY